MTHVNGLLITLWVYTNNRYTKGSTMKRRGIRIRIIRTVEGVSYAIEDKEIGRETMKEARLNARLFKAVLEIKAAVRRKPFREVRNQSPT